jgi:methionine-gamma-lyase
VRLRAQTETAHTVASFLEGHEAVVDLRYPGLASHPQFDLAKRQLELAGALIAFDLPGGYEAGVRFVESLQLVQHAPSLGGPETLVCHPASTIRLSIGLEGASDLIADLSSALAAA